MIVALLFGIADCIAAPFEKIQRDLYYAEFFILAFLFIIRYYYGPDIATYVPLYENIESLDKLWAHRGDWLFEPGFMYVCSLLHGIGLTYWGLTTTITVVYFLAIFLLFRSLHRYRAVSLAALVLLDYNLIYIEIRQAIAVSLLIFMVLLIDHRRYIWAIVMAVGCALMHKTGIAAVLVVWCYWFFRNVPMKTYIYETLALLLLVFMVLPVSNITDSIIHLVPLSESVSQSIEHHLSLGRQIQVVAGIYLMVLIISAYFVQHIPHSRRNIYLYAAFLGVVVLVVFYQYYFLLNRLRSYFLPFIILFIAQTAEEQDTLAHPVPYGKVVLQTCMVVVFLYFGYSMYRFKQQSDALHAPITKASTVFDLRHYSQPMIRERQMRIAVRYWEEDYMKSNDNKLQ